MSEAGEPQIRIGVIGAGDVARRHIEALRREPGVLFTWVADPDRGRCEALAAAHGIRRASADAEEICRAADVDLVLVLTPHDLHLPQASAALRAGKDVFCEKPLGRTAAECDAILRAASESGRRLLVTHALRADFFYVTARRRIAAGAIGRPLLGIFFWHTDELERLEDPGHWKGTRDRSGGGVLIDGGCHVADLASGLLGPARRVSACGARLVARAEDRGEDNAVFAVEYASGAMATFACSFTAGRAFRVETFGCGMEAEISGTEGSLRGGYVFRDWNLRRFYRECRAGIPDAEYHPPEDLPVIDQLLLRSLRGGEPPPVTALDARNAVAVIDAAYRSMESGRWETVDWRDA